MKVGLVAGCILVSLVIVSVFGNVALVALVGGLAWNYGLPAVWSFFTGPRFDNRLAG
jgi:hypothetical protein